LGDGKDLRRRKLFNSAGELRKSDCFGGLVFIKLILIFLIGLIVSTKNSEKSDEVLLIWIQKLELSNEEISIANISSHLNILDFSE